MAKKRIHQIAKELDLASADILHQAKELGIEVKTASSGLTEEEEELVKLALMPEDEPEVESEEVSEQEENIQRSNDDDLKEILDINTNQSNNDQSSDKSLEESILKKINIDENFKD